MRVKSAVLAGLLCVLSLAAQADITRVSPTSFSPSGEDFIDIYGSSLTGGVQTTVLFDGAVEVEAQFASDNHVIVWVPVEVLSVEGQHCLVVRSIDQGGVRTHGPACFTVVVPDTGGDGPPVLSLPEIVGAEAESVRGANVTYEAGASDGDLTCTHPSGSLFVLGATSVTCSATNTSGTATGSFQVIVTDTTPPVLALPADVDSPDPVVTYSATAVDNVDGSVTVSCSPASGSTFSPGSTTVQCRATDAHFNSSFGSFRVRVAGGAPVLILPDDMLEEATSPAGAVVTFTATSDDGTPVVCVPASGSTFALGTAAVNCTAGAGSGSFNVTVSDTTAPVITAPAQVTAEATSPAGASVTYVVTAEDVVDGDIIPNCAPPSGSAFAFGVTDVVCTATDTRNNADSTAFQVTVEDTTPPVVTSISASPASLWPPNHQMINVVVTATVVDAVDPMPAVKILSVSSNQPVNGTGDGDMGPDWKITGPMTLQLRAERAGNSKTDRVYTITVQTQDSTGNVGTARVTVTVADTKKRTVRS
ncbi:MAG TPA: HYR domain-containing protein [Thermoanaerobaculia bacterium]|jgi:hypothetical protein